MVVVDRDIALARILHHPIAKRNAASSKLVGKGEVAKDFVGLGRRQLGLLTARQPRWIDNFGRLGKGPEKLRRLWVAGFSVGDF